MDEGSVFEQLLNIATCDPQKFAAMAADVYPTDDPKNSWREVGAYRASREFVFGANAGLFLALRLLRFRREMKRNACGTRYGWTIQEPTSTDENGTRVVIVTKNPATQWFIVGSEEKCPGGP